MKRQLGAGWQVSGVIEATPEEVWKTMIKLNPALPDSVRRDAANTRAQQPLVTSVGKPGESREHIRVDKADHKLTIQGEWWYRGVYSVAPHKRGSLLTYSVYNIAPGIGHWAAQLVQGPQHARGMKREVTKLIENIGTQLACRTFLVD